MAFPIPNLPTDSTYKFITFLGLIGSVACMVATLYFEPQTTQLSKEGVAHKHLSNLADIKERDSLIMEDAKIFGKRYGYVYVDSIKDFRLKHDSLYNSAKAGLFYKKWDNLITKRNDLRDKELELKMQYNEHILKAMNLEFRNKLKEIDQWFFNSLFFIFIFLFLVGIVAWMYHHQGLYDIILMKKAGIDEELINREIKKYQKRYDKSKPSFLARIFKKKSNE